MNTKLEIIKNDLPPFNKYIFEEIEKENIRSHSDLINYFFPNLQELKEQWINQFEYSMLVSNITLKVFYPKGFTINAELLAPLNLEADEIADFKFDYWKDWVKNEIDRTIKDWSEKHNLYETYQPYKYILPCDVYSTEKYDVIEHQRFELSRDAIEAKRELEGENYDSYDNFKIILGVVDRNGKRLTLRAFPPFRMDNWRFVNENRSRLIGHSQLNFLTDVKLESGHVDRNFIYAVINE